MTYESLNYDQTCVKGISWKNSHIEFKKSRLQSNSGITIVYDHKIQLLHFLEMYWGVENSENIEIVIISLKKEGMCGTIF